MMYMMYIRHSTATGCSANHPLRHEMEAFHGKQGCRVVIGSLLLILNDQLGSLHLEKGNTTYFLHDYLPTTLRNWLTTRSNWLAASPADVAPVASCSVT